MHRLSVLIILSIFLLIGSLHGQDFEVFECEVDIRGKILEYPFTGGFGAPQFSESDFNNDGVVDLFVFDRAGFVSMVFLRESTGLSEAFSFSKDYNKYLPDLSNWALLRDYNGDGIMDIFSNPTQGISGVQLHQGFLDNGILKYKLRPMKIDPTKQFDIIYTEIPGGSDTNVYVPFTDIPDIVDIDADGDLDIISFEGNSGSYVYFYKNEQVEKGLPSDTMSFVIEDFCFGKFKESGVNSSIFLSDDGSCASEYRDGQEEVPEKAHAGSTIMAFDVDGDLDMEVLIGDLTNNHMVYLLNGGTPDANLMTERDPTFPSYNLLVDMPVFLSSFNVDGDGDGMKDIVVSTNGFSSVQNVDNTWLYRYSGTPGFEYNLIQKDFLSSETLDLGSFTYPTFADYNQDGLMDLFVASGGIYSTGRPEIRIYLFENVGTDQVPAFKMVDDNYENFSEFSNTSRNPSLAFGDLDQDGDEDLLIGEEEGNLYFLENRAGPGNTFDFGSPRYQYMDISVSQKSRPFIADLNEDGLNDIILGQRKTVGRDTIFGNVNYYQNIGTFGNPMFESDVTVAPNIPVLGAMTTRSGLSTALAGSTTPFVYKYNGEWNFVLGSETGFLRHYTTDGEDLSAVFNEAASDFGNVREGLQSSPALYDIDNDGFLEMAVGNLRGGISFFNTDLLVDMVSVFDLEKPTLDIFPNPVKHTLNINWHGKSKLEYRAHISDASGRLVMSAQDAVSIDVSSLDSGIYLIEIWNDDFRTVEKIIKY